jgi:hypothetical protein
VSVAARHVHGVATVAEAHPREPSPVLPLLLLVIGLAAATVWFVALPALEKPPPGRSCEVFVLRSGTTKCVPQAGARALAKKPKPARRAKR